MIVIEFFANRLTPPQMVVGAWLLVALSGVVVVFLDKIG